MARASTTPAPKRRKRLSPIERFLALPDEEKERQVAEFDRPFIADTFKPLTPARRRLWEKAKRRKPGRPRTGEGVKTIALSVEKGLLRRADALARRRKMTRAALVAEALEATLARAG